MLRLLPTVLVLAVWIYAFIDCLNTPENEVRKLPKVAWVLIVLFFGTVLLGPIAWFVAGRPRRNAPYGAVRPAERRWVAPDDNPEFLRTIGERTRRPEAEPAEEKPSDERAASAETERSEKRPEKKDEPIRDEGRNKESGGPEDNVPPAA
ncbi:PLD nuclease N-terminal domain-containing protein [Streptomyces macrosporus]|uniref:PLD nuclease N-terminal domain-containing protein n=1 Tax=Streptomyces macrosporus TaxID=44032 RepID=A0ABP5W8D1_9ACTN